MLPLKPKGAAEHMIVESVRFNYAEGISRFEARICKSVSPGLPFVGYIAFEGEVKAPDALGDPFLAACLLPSMFIGEDLEIGAPVSRMLVESMATVQDIFLTWYPTDFRRIQVKTPHVLSNSTFPKENATAAFFSGGVDSWYSLLKHRDRVGVLLTVNGFDISIENTKVYDELVDAGREVAHDFGMSLLAVETNLRLGLDPGFGRLGKSYPDDFWGPVLHGAFLGAVGLCLQRHFGQVVIPSSYPYDFLFPWGSHPLLDALWSTDLTCFEHDGCEAGRTRKVQRIAECSMALRRLRVCAANEPGVYNCGTCEKCCRTMLALGLFGKLAADAPFSKLLDLAALELQDLPASKVHWYVEILAVAQAGGPPEIIHVLQVILGQKRSWRRDWQWLSRKLGLPKHRRSFRKRWDRLRGFRA